jgi:catechol 2,3-dioxygenase-like lactoylglutathione lyase family enzyme
VTVLFAGIVVSELEAAVGFYRRLLDAEPDMYPNEREACWRLTDQAWLYVLADPAGAGRSTATVIVDDLDALAAGLAARGIAIDSRVAVDGGMEKLEVLDPDGNRIGFGGPAGPAAG